MENIVENNLSERGIKQLKILSSAEVEIKLWKYVPLFLLKQVPWTIEAEQSFDAVENVMSTVVRYPVIGPVDVMRGDGSFRRCFVVHRQYGKGISDCLRLAVDGWMCVMRQAPLHGYVAKLPANVEAGLMVHGVDVYEAEWMMRDCVAVR